MSSLIEILNARVYDVAKETPLQEAIQLSERLENQIYLKREDLQPVHSFKLRGAYNKMAQLTQAERERGVIAASAGNHAQGVALSAQKLGIPATIVMPATTPEIKYAAVAQRGAEVVLYGETFDLACAHAYQMADEKGLTFIHPYDDPHVIAGQGTVGLELLKELPDVDAVFVPVGGGGLLAGVAAAIGTLKPDVHVIGVESVDSACCHAALQAGQRVALDRVGLFADGVAVAQIGEKTLPIIRKYVDTIVRVETDEICAAIKDIFGDTRAIAEPAGALAVAGMKKAIQEYGWKGKRVAAIVSGANVNFHNLRYVSERSELGEGTEGLFSVTIPERPGSFHTFCLALGHRAITEFNYRYAHEDNARVFVGVRIRDVEEREALVQSLRNDGYEIQDLSDNEMAKLHLRYMVGGHAPNLENERLFRFEFPERPGALENFLSQLAGRWNISIFHYRNHAASHGRVLAGLTVPTQDDDAFADFLEGLGYPYIEETENPAYVQFFGTCV